MNTRRKFLQPKPDVPSSHWHLMKESYHVIFVPEYRDHVEYWYNMGATGVQRDLFRDICKEIYAQNPDAADPDYPSEFTALMHKEEAYLMLKNFGLTLTDLGQRKARVWILHVANRRRRDNFRDVFTGCQSIFKNISTMKTDYAPPEDYRYPDNRTYFHRDVDWTSLRGRNNIQKLNEQREKEAGLEREMKLEVGPQRPRFTKPKNQFDGVNVLSTLGYGDMSPEEAIAQMTARRNAHQESEKYYVDKDGSTVYRAGVQYKATSSKGEGRNLIGGVITEPIGEWKVKSGPHYVMSLRPGYPLVLYSTMAIEGIVSYRLLGNDHPAASGKHMQLSFPGESTLVSTVLDIIIQKHHINEGMYKLVMTLLRPSDGSVPQSVRLTRNDVLRNYDRIEIDISKRNYTEEARLDAVAARQEEVEPVVVLKDVRPPTAPRRANNDALLYQRAANITAKALPLRLSASKVKESEEDGVCVLCDLPLMNPARLPCCGHMVCNSCRDTAETMMPSGSQCAVCGNNIQSSSAQLSKLQPKASNDMGGGQGLDLRDGVKSEAPGEIKAHTKPMSTKLALGGPTVPNQERAVEEFTAKLRDYLHNSLSMLDADTTTPLSAACRHKRQRSEELTALDLLAKAGTLGNAEDACDDGLESKRFLLEIDSNTCCVRYTAKAFCYDVETYYFTLASLVLLCLLLFSLFAALCQQRIAESMNIPLLCPSTECPTEATLFGTEPPPSSAFVYVNDMLPLYEELFTETQELNVCITTFNVACKKPPLPLTGIAALKNTKTGKPTDVIALAFQEVDMSASALFREETEASQPWIAGANEALGANSQPRADSPSPYFALPPKQMVGLLLCVYVRRELVGFIREYNIALVPTGALGSVGNKGAVGLRLALHRSSICFLSAHLAAGQNSVSKRNASIETILTTMDFNALKRAEYEQLQGNSNPMHAMSLLPPIRLREQDIVIIAGDLNYRLNLTYEQSLRLTVLKRYKELLTHDQLIAELKNRHTPWWGFRDLTPTFPPTYRFDIGTNVYDTSEKHRIPGYTDRYCVYMKDPNQWDDVQVDSMEALMNVKSSDHKPVVACLRLPVRVEIPSKREALEANLKQQFETLNPTSVFRTDTTVSCSVLPFGKLQIYRDSASQSVTLTNTGSVAASIRIVRVRDTKSDPTEASWLRVSPLELVILPGKSKSITVTTAIDPGLCPWLSSWRPFEGRGTLSLCSSIKLVVRSSPSHLLTCTAELLPSIFGNRLDYISALGNKVCAEAYHLRGDFAYEMRNVVAQVPKELWRMADAIARFPDQPGIFTRSLDTSCVQKSMELLDMSNTSLPGEHSNSALVAGECLLSFLRQLLDPVIPREFYEAALDAIKGKGPSPPTVLKKVPAVHANAFLYIMSLLQFLLLPEHAEHNGLTSDIVSDLFSDAMFRPQIKPSPSPASPAASPAASKVPNVNQQDRERLEDEQELAKRFIAFFLTGPSPLQSAFFCFFWAMKRRLLCLLLLDMPDTPVYLYRYDLSKGMVRSLAPLLLGRPLEGIWHTSIVVFGAEFYFGGQESVMRTAPETTHYGVPNKKELLGTTAKTETEFLAWIEEQKRGTFGPDHYDILQNNCNDFTQAAAQFLMGKNIPEDVRKLIPELMASPLGQIIGPVLQQSTAAQRGPRQLCSAVLPGSRRYYHVSVADKQTTTTREVTGKLHCNSFSFAVYVPLSICLFCLP
eukprot:gene8443-5921_t